MKLTLNEDLFPEIELPEQEVEVVAEEPLPGPEPGNDTGIADILMDLIKDEYEAIQGYQGLIPNLDTHPEMVTIINDIVAEEYTHVGQLSELLKVIAPNAEKIAEGHLEATGQLQEAVQSYDRVELEKPYHATVFEDGRVYIHSSHPYDNAEYHWAFSKDGGQTYNIYINSPGRLVKKFKADEDQEYQDIVAELKFLDKDIKSVRAIW